MTTQPSQQAASVGRTRSGGRMAGVLRPLRLGMIFALALLTTTIAAPTASVSAVDANCTRVQMHGSGTEKDYVLREGVGFVAWRVYLSIWASDRCDHGRLQVMGGVDDAAVQAKGGHIGFVVLYQLSNSSRWFRLPLLNCATATSCSYGDSGHFDLWRSVRITKVRLHTWLNFDGDVYSPRNFTCNLVTRTCG